MKSLLLCIITVLMWLVQGSNCLSQEVSTKQIQVDSDVKHSEIGTYQIQVINSRNKPYIPVNIDEIVVKNRHATEVVFVTFGDEVRLKILPTSAIKSIDFTPLDQISYINE